MNEYLNSVLYGIFLHAFCIHSDQILTNNYVYARSLNVYQALHVSISTEGEMNMHELLLKYVLYSWIFWKIAKFDIKKPNHEYRLIQSINYHLGLNTILYKLFADLIVGYIFACSILFKSNILIRLMLSYVMYMKVK